MDVKRPLTDNEKTKIVDECFLDFSIDPQLRADLQFSIQAEIDRQCKGLEIYESQIDKFIQTISKQYIKAIIHPGETVGEQAAQSMGAPTTQMALNAFHAAGKITRMTTGGLPRMIELTNCSKDKDIKNPSCTIYFNREFNSVDDIPLDQIMETCISHLVTDYDIFTYDPANIPWWYKFYQCLYGKIGFTDYYLRLYLDKDELFKRRVLPKTIAELIIDKISPVACIYSPVQQSIIDVFIDTSMVAVPEALNTELLTVEILARRLIRDYIVPTILDFYIKGVKDVKAVYPLKDHSGEYFVETDGSNLRGVLELDFVCPKRTMCNRPMEIFEIFGVLGLEAYYRREFTNVFEQSASYVNPSWIDLLVHHICHTGKPVPVNRFGHMKKQEVSTLTKATFEEMTTHLIRAGLFGYHDPLDSIAGRIVTGKRGKHGTGMVDVMVDTDTIQDLEYPSFSSGPESIHVDIQKAKLETLRPRKNDADADADAEAEGEDDASASPASSVNSVAAFEFDDDPDDDDDFVDF